MPPVSQGPEEEKVVQILPAGLAAAPAAIGLCLSGACNRLSTSCRGELGRLALPWLSRAAWKNMAARPDGWNLSPAWISCFLRRAVARHHGPRLPLCCSQRLGPARAVVMGLGVRCGAERWVGGERWALVYIRDGYFTCSREDIFESESQSFTTIPSLVPSD
jgi:hypothetical protein